MRGTQSVSISFEDVHVAADDVIGPLNLLIEMEFIPGLCASYVGIAESAYRVAREVARKNVKRAVDSPQGHGHPDAGRLFSSIGQMRFALEPAWHMTVRAAQTGDVGGLDRAWSLMQAKYLVGEMVADVTARAIRVVGARSLDTGCPLERLFRDAQAALVMAMKPDHASYLAGRFELGILPYGMTVQEDYAGYEGAGAKGS
jgi:alkylation response protein AidB-like acyl-CoA dehydrogenase